jgi:hypothetical protein
MTSAQHLEISSGERPGPSNTVSRQSVTTFSFEKAESSEVERETKAEKNGLILTIT